MRDAIRGLSTRAERAEARVREVEAERDALRDELVALQALEMNHEGACARLTAENAALRADLREMLPAMLGAQVLSELFFEERYGSTYAAVSARDNNDNWMRLIDAIALARKHAAPEVNP